MQIYSYYYTNYTNSYHCDIDMVLPLNFNDNDNLRQNNVINAIKNPHLKFGLSSING